MKKVIGENFNEILITRIMTEISKAFNVLQMDLYHMGDEEAKRLVEEFEKQIKNVVNCYIDEQKTTFFKIRNSFQ